MLRLVRNLVKALVAEDTPQQLAAGLALGMAAGLIPKSSLFAHLGLMLVCMLQVNLAAGLASAALFSIVSPLLDPVTHALGGLFLVKLGFLAPVWTFLYNVPVLPWTRFNNTVVLGSLLLGTALVYPAYLAAIPLCEKYRETAAVRLRKLKLVKILLGADLAGKLGKGEG